MAKLKSCLLQTTPLLLATLVMGPQAAIANPQESSVPQLHKPPKDTPTITFESPQDPVTEFSEFSPQTAPETRIQEIEAIVEEAETSPNPSNQVSDSTPIIEELNRYSNDNINRSINQDGLGATQFSDVAPGDWAFSALNDLVRRYDCLKGYPDGTYRGNQSLSRYEFAAGLNACLQQIERLIATTTAEFVTQEDLEAIQRLTNKFEAELATLATRVDNLEGRVTFLEENQFSTTTKLNGEVLFVLSDFFSGTQPYDLNGTGAFDAGDDLVEDGELVFQNRIRLHFDTSFTGRDRLRTRLQSRNVDTFTPVDGTVTREGRFGFEGDEDNDVFVSKIEYRFPLSEQAQMLIGLIGMDLYDIAPPLNPFESTGGGSISRFGQYNPIYRIGGQGNAIGVRVSPSDSVMLSMAYSAGEANTPGAGSGLFNGDYGAIGQITFQPSEKFGIAAQYVHGYRSGGLRPSVGSLASDLRGFDYPVVSNAYGIEALFQPSPQFFVGGWVGYTAGRVINTGDTQIWNYAVTVGINDVGTEGSRIGLIFGQEPRLAYADESLGNIGFEGLATGIRSDYNAGFHVEGFYNLKLSDNIDITPGVIWLTDPNHNEQNPDIVIGTIRTRFRF